MKAALTAALVLFGLNYALGLSLQFGSRWHVRWLHHALFFSTCAGVATAWWLAWRSGHAWWPLAVSLAALLGVSRTRPGRAPHAVVASVAGVALGVAAKELL